MVLSEKIKSLRQRAGLTQAQLADELFVSRAAIAKWENANGTPDISNLKAISERFQVDLDLLLDDSRALPLEVVIPPCDTAATYCGNDCDACTYKESNDCPGCKKGPGYGSVPNCRIAHCCVKNSHAQCTGCGLSGNCAIFGLHDTMPQQWVMKRQQDHEAFLLRRRRGRFFGKWLWILFWLFIPSILIGFFSSDTLLEAYPSLLVPMCILNALIVATESGIYFHLSRHELRFKKVGICVLIVGIVNLLKLAVTGGAITQSWDFSWMIPSNIIEIYCMYHESHAYSNILSKTDWELSDKWQFLWKLFLVMYAATIAAIALILFSKVLAALALVAVSITAIVIEVLKLVYRYKTAKVFRNYYC